MISRKWEKHRCGFIACSIKTNIYTELRFFFHISRVSIDRTSRITHVLPCSCYGNFTSPSFTAWCKFANNSNLRFVQDRKGIDANELYRSFRREKKWKQDFFAVFRQSDGSIVSYRALYGKAGQPTQWPLVACLFINIRAETAIAVDIVTYGQAEKHPSATFYT